MSDLAVPDAGRLVEAAPRLHHHLSDALVLEQHPAFQHVHELQLAVVRVPLAVRSLFRPRTDDVREHLAPGGALDAEIAVLEVAAQPAAREACAREVCHMKAPAHGPGIVG